MVYQQMAVKFLSSICAYNDENGMALIIIELRKTNVLMKYLYKFGRTILYRVGRMLDC